MRKNKTKPYGQLFHEIGTPYYLYDNDSSYILSRSRVVPSQFTFPILPLGCSFVKNLGTDDSVLL